MMVRYNEQPKATCQGKVMVLPEGLHFVQFKPPGMADCAFAAAMERAQAKIAKLTTLFMDTMFDALVDTCASDRPDNWQAMEDMDAIDDSQY
ncbi:hypothetical protein LCGC14_1996080 [marine sediment metagenome]|uniref:Uncharacterized protein n=1 Tax=marine sediment metagenome TaxID=412755 RepID=A0A0F9HI34_9ZZZZ